MHRIRLGKRQRPSDKPSQSLTQSVVEPLNMTRLTRALARRSMLGCGQYFGIRLPKVRVQQAPLVRFGNTTPQQTTQTLSASPNSISHNLACAAALS